MLRRITGSVATATTTAGSRDADARDQLDMHPEPADAARDARFEAVRAQRVPQPGARAGGVAVGDPVDVVDLAQRHRPLVGEAMSRRQQQVDDVVTEPCAGRAGRDRGGAALPVLDDREVEVAGEDRGQGLLGLAVGEDHAQVRVRVAQAGQRRRGEGVHRGRDGADAQLADHLVAQPVEVEPGGGDAGEDLRGVLREHPAGGGEAQAAARRLGEGGARLALELGELLRHRRGREVQGGRGAGDRALARERVERAEPVEGEHFSDRNGLGAGNIAGP
jgi:hypothetical protein